MSMLAAVDIVLALSQANMALLLIGFSLWTAWKRWQADRVCECLCRFLSPPTIFIIAAYLIAVSTARLIDVVSGGPVLAAHAAAASVCFCVAALLNGRLIRRSARWTEQR